MSNLPFTITLTLLHPFFLENQKTLSASPESFFAEKRSDFIFLSPRSTLVLELLLLLELL
jgi:hypothetical protein